MAIKAGNISMRQALIIYLLLLGSSEIRIIPLYAIKMAGSAGWLSPILAAAVLLLYFFLMQKIFIKYDQSSLIEIMESIFGKLLGRAVGFIFFIYITLITVQSLRIYAARLSLILDINTSYVVFIGIILVFLSLIIKNDVPVFARLCEILLIMVGISYLIINVLVLPEIKLSNLYPITAEDVFPIGQAAFNITATWGYISFVLIFSDRISNKKNMCRLGLKFTILLVIITCFAIILPLGVLGPSAKEVTSPYIAAIQTIFLFDTIERIESLVVAIWIITDFAFIAALIFSGLHAFRGTFKCSDYRHYQHVYFLLIFFLSIFIANSAVETIEFGRNILKPGNNILCFGIPFILFLVGKVRKKI